MKWLAVTASLVLIGCKSEVVKPDACDIRSAVLEVQTACMNEIMDMNQHLLDLCAQPNGNVIEFYVTDRDESVFIKCEPVQTL